MTLSASEDDFSFQSNADYEGDCELGDYFSDDEEENNQITELGDYFSEDISTMLLLHNPLPSLRCTFFQNML